MTSPRSEFLKNDEFVKQHNKLMDNAALRRGFETAMAEMTRAMCALASGHDLNSPGREAAAAASFDMICGAYNFCEVFERLAQPYAKVEKPEKISSLREVE